ncbi:MAG: hypothetical protein GX823_07310 [Clostridiales bacterium]|nr:hypothetical protein [Clostridiales bacterium]
MMTKRLTIIVAVAVLLALAIGTGVGMLAAGTAGSADDPLITLSYLNEKFKVELIKDIDVLIKARGDEISAKVDAAISDSPGGNAASADVFKVVTLRSGQTLTLNEGSELLVREGTALVSGAAIANTTTGGMTAAGAAALVNNMYLATASNSGVYANTESVKILVRGGYAISG